MRVYVTGGTGFIGSYTSLELAKAGHEVIILARNPQKAPALAKIKNIKIVKANLSDFVSVKKALIKPDALVHIALCWGDTGPEMIEKETLPSVRLLELAINKGAKKIIYTSSTAASGYYRKRIDENCRLIPTDFYGATKGAVEMFVSAYAHYNPKLKINVIRPGYTFGNPAAEGCDMEPDNRFRQICADALAGRTIQVIKNDGTQFIWAGDLALLYRKALESNLTKETFYGLSKNFLSWEQAAKWAVKYCKSKSKIETLDYGYSEDPVMFSVENMRSHFGLSFNSQEKVKEHIRYILGM